MLKIYKKLQKFVKTQNGAKNLFYFVIILFYGGNEMITLKLKIADKMQDVNIKEDVIFNAMLLEHKEVIKPLIKATIPTYRIKDQYFKIVNPFIDFKSDCTSLYPGFIVRTNLYDYAVLFLQGSILDEANIIEIIKEYIYDTTDSKPKEINVNLIEINKKTFLKVTRNI